MFSSLQRLQQVTNHAISVLFAISLFIALSSYWQLQKSGAYQVSTQFNNTPVTSHTYRTSRHFGSQNRDKKENIKLDLLSLSVDLSPLFNYNTKQVFTYLTFEYDGYNSLSQSKITFWDRIITDQSQAQLDLSTFKGKYSVWDVSPKSNFTNYEGTLRLEWNVQPYVGFLLWGETKGGIEITI